jgi:competence protein ComEC
MTRKNLKYFFIAGGLVIALLISCIITLPDGKLHVYFLDVGQGDAALIRTPLNKFILVDGGPDDSVLRGLGDIMPFYTRTIDLIILTHPHPDHINGLIEVLKRYKVDKVFMTGINYHYAGYDEFLDLLAKNSIPVTLADGHDFDFGGTKIDVIFPIHSLQGREFENINNSSIVFRLIYGKSIFYFSGDAEKPEEEDILAAHADVNAEVLKVGHHGSRTASSEAMIGLIHPFYAVISCGKDNSFKHPHAETIDTLTKHDAKILRTDLMGTIGFESDGNVIRRD